MGIVRKPVEYSACEIAWSPDGRYLLYSRHSLNYQLVLFDLKEDKEIPLTVGDDMPLCGENPVWHPSGQSFYYSWASKLGRFVLAQGAEQEYFRVENYWNSTSGTRPTEIWKDEFLMSPDGGSLLFFHKKGEKPGEVIELCVVGSKSDTLFSGPSRSLLGEHLYSRLSWLSSNVMLVQADKVYAFNLSSRKVDVVFDEICYPVGNGAGTIALSRNREVKTLFGRVPFGETELFLYDQNSLSLTKIYSQREFIGGDFLPTWSADGSRLAFHGQQGVCVYSASSGEIVNVMRGSFGHNSLPAFSPDGSLIACCFNGNEILIASAETGEKIN